MFAFLIGIGHHEAVDVYQRHFKGFHLDCIVLEHVQEFYGVDG
jgi:hypothetical protein